MLEPLVKGGQVKISQTQKGIEIEIKDSALFATGQAQPSASSVQMLTQMAGLLNKVDNSVSVEGFTDDVPIKTSVFPSNWELSAARAGSVVRLFQENGMAPARLVAVGRAENMPVADNGTTEGRARNRRVSITVLANDVLAPGQSLQVEQMKAMQDGAPAPAQAAPAAAGVAGQ